MYKLINYFGGSTLKFIKVFAIVDISIYIVVGVPSKHA